MANLALKGGNPVTQEAFPTWPIFGNSERSGLLRVLESGNWGSTKGDEVASFEQQFAKLHSAKHGIALSSGTTALSIALKAAGVEAGDEVIVPAYTFIASATAIMDALATPVVVDTEVDTLNIDPEKVRAAITAKTKAIMPVHFAGRPANMPALSALAKEHNLVIVEDAAQAWGSRNAGHDLASLSEAACFSFQSSKNINSGEGGIILTNDDTVAELSRSFINCGRSSTGLWYAHYNLGGNYRLTEFQGALLHAQFARYPELHKKREKAACFLFDGITKLAGYQNLRPLEQDARSSWHIFAFSIDTTAWKGINKEQMVEALRAEGIPVSPGYSLPVHQQPVFSDHKITNPTFDNFPAVQNLELPNTEKACAETTLWITQNMLLADEGLLERVLEALAKVYAYKDELISVPA